MGKLPVYRHNIKVFSRSGFMKSLAASPYYPILLAAIRIVPTKIYLGWLKNGFLVVILPRIFAHAISDSSFASSNTDE
jgi:hypothetical protein